MVEVKRTIRIVTEQKILPEVPSGVEGFPMRTWGIKIYLVNDQGQDVPATCFEKVQYQLHPTFANPNPIIRKPPFALQEQGWGEFDMTIVCTLAEKNGDYSVQHDLNFQKNKYDALHTLTFKNVKPGVLRILRESGPVPEADENGVKKVLDKKKRKSTQNVDMERLADGLQKLSEDDLLEVVQMVHDNKAPDTYVKNDVEQGEFHVDLYTLPDNLVKMLWDFTTAKVDI